MCVCVCMFLCVCLCVCVCVCMERRGGRWGQDGVVLEIFAFGVLVLHCMCVYACADVNMCVSVQCPLLWRRGFCKKHEARGEFMATGEETEHQAPLISALGFVTSPAVSQRSVEGRHYARER